MPRRRKIRYDLLDDHMLEDNPPGPDGPLASTVMNYELRAEQENKKQKKKLDHPYQLERMEIKDPEYMSEVPNHLQNKSLPGFPTVILAVGKPGSGKTNVLVNLLTRPELWKGFYDKIYLLGPTIESDKLYQHLDIPQDQKVSDPAEFIEKLREWTDHQIEEVKRDPKKAAKALFVFEDITSYYHTIQNNPIFIKCFNTIRHHKATAYVNIHKVKSLNRTPRMSCQHILVFPINKTEIDMVYQDWGPQNLSKQDFYYMCLDTWKSSEDSEKPFLYINNHAPENKRFKRNFTDIIDTKYYEGIHKKMELAKKREREGLSGKRNTQRQQNFKEDGGFRQKAKKHIQSNYHLLKKDGVTDTEFNQFIKNYYNKQRQEKLSVPPQ